LPANASNQPQQAPERTGEQVLGTTSDFAQQQGIGAAAGHRDQHNPSPRKEISMTSNPDRIWLGGSFQSTRAPLDPSLIELAVQSSGRSVKRVCVSHLHRLHSNLSEEQLLSQICPDCPARFYFASQVQQP